MPGARTVLRNVLVAIVVSLPIAILTTILLLPFWSWIEKTTGIESIGHAGPAVWCFVVIYAVVLAGCTFLFERLARSRRSPAD